MTSCTHCQVSPRMRRLLATSSELGWLLSMQCTDGTSLCGTVDHVDADFQSFFLITPHSLYPERFVAISEIRDLTMVSIALMQGQRLVARFAEIPSWRGGADQDGHVVGDIFAGDASPGTEGVVLLSSGARHMGIVTARQQQRCRIALNRAVHPETPTTT